MRARLLDVLVCPGCRGTLALESSAGAGWSPVADPALDVVEGRLVCTACPRRFPVVDGIPRLLGPELLRPLAARHDAFFARHPEFLAGAANGAHPLADTMDSFTRQRLDLRPPGPESAHQWREHLARNLGGALRVDALRGKRVLDVGCGFGRHLYVANEAGAETVGVDLSGGVEVARRNNARFPNCQVVQANILERPFRDGAFDVVWSFGVLHHMPEPRAGFDAMVPLARPDGGLVVIWVYGYRGMAFTYRLSHMRRLHRVIRGLSAPARVQASRVVAALLSAGYWEPLRLVQSLGGRGLVERLPLAMYVDHGWLARVAAVHDRLSTPITHFHDREELLDWFAGQRLADAVVEDTDRRGWRAHAKRAAAAA